MITTSPDRCTYEDIEVDKDTVCTYHIDKYGSELPKTMVVTIHKPRYYCLRHALGFDNWEATIDHLKDSFYA